MSAANCPETPRQKMIGMMYLFLTAMLALNVSKEILNAFVVVNKGLETTNANYEGKNNATMGAIHFAYTNDKVKVRPTYDAAKAVQKRANQMVAYIDTLKRNVINVTVGEPLNSLYADTVPLIDIEAKDDYDAPTRYFMGMSTTDGKESVDGIGGEAPKLREELQTYVSDLKSYMKQAKVKGVDNLGDLGVNTQDPNVKNSDNPEDNHWASSKFYHLPLAATVAILTQMENQVRNAEATALNRLLSNIGATDMKVDNLEARVVPKSTYIVQGGEYEADLFVAAWSSTNNPKVIVGPANALDTNTLEFKTRDTIHVPVVDGIGKYKVKTSSLGEKRYASIIEVKNTSTGEVNKYPLTVDGDYFASYMVAKPSAVISPTKMNVFYIGVDNPVSISVPGFAAQNISPSITGGTITAKNKAKGEYIVKVKKGRVAKIRVTATDENGKSFPFPAQDFRIKKVPAPVAKVAGMTSGKITKSKFLAAGGIKAEMENFDFELPAVVTSFTVSLTINGLAKDMPVKGNRFDPVQRDLKKLRRGTRITLTDIKAKVAGGMRKLSPISFKLD